MPRKIIDLIPATGSDYDFTWDNHAIWTTAQFYLFVRGKMRDYVFDSVATTESGAKAELKELYGLWCAAMGENVWRALSAFYSDYNPIENYNREELGTEDIARHKGTKRARNEDVSETPTTMTTTGSVTAYDSGTENEISQAVTMPTGSNTRVALAASNYEIETDIDGTTYDHDTTSFDGRVTRGNIGTLTTQSMISSELELRSKNIMFDYMAMFVNEFCYLVKGVEV